MNKVISVENGWGLPGREKTESFWMEEAALTKEENTELLFLEGQVRKKCRLIFCIY